MGRTPTPKGNHQYNQGRHISMAYQKRNGNSKTAREAGIRSSVQGTPKSLFQRKQAARQSGDSESEPQLSRLKGKELLQALRERYPKKLWKPSVMLVPNPVVLVSCGGGKSDYRANVFTVAWAGIVNTEPAMVSISVRPERFSHEIISETREFVINVPTVRMAKIVDWCGMKSGRDVDKFAEMKLTALPSEHLGCPIVADCPLNIECKVAKVIPLGSHDLILAKIVGVQVSDSILDKKGKLRVDAADFLGYAHGEYHELGKKVGTFGFSVKKR